MNTTLSQSKANEGEFCVCSKIFTDFVLLLEDVDAPTHRGVAVKWRGGGGGLSFAKLIDLKFYINFLKVLLGGKLVLSQ